MLQFTDLDLIPALQRALAQEGYQTPTEIQARAIPPLLGGKDVLGCAQTGTGKTAAFLLPILQHLETNPPRQGRRIRALVLTPTRELAAQIGASASAYGRFLRHRHTVIFGGCGEQPQIQALRAGVDLLIATPGRLLDLMGRNHVDLSRVELFVLDEADRMLDMGFIHDVKRVIASLPARRQNLLFSATLPPTIVKLASSFLRDPVSVSVTPTGTTVERIEQRVMFVPKAEKLRTLLEHLCARDVTSAIVFTRTKHGANRLAQQLSKSGVEAEAIHGNKSQGARTRTLEAFRRGTLPVLVATDLASRGIDIDGVSHVINYELPNEPASYVHRIGRTGRAGRDGVAIALCDPSERPLLADIERLVGRRLTSGDQGRSQPAPLGGPAEASLPAQPLRERSRDDRQGGGNSRSGNGRSGNGRAVHGHSGNGRSSHGRTDGRSSHGRTGNGRSSNGRSSNGRSGNGRSGNGRSSNGRSDNGRSRQERSGSGGEARTQAIPSFSR